MNLKEIDIKKFKKNIYPEYKKLFPSIERKDYKTIKKLNKKNITKIIEIMVDDNVVGFFILNLVKDCQYICLDYFAILSQYQSKGYGSEALKLLKQMYNTYNGIYIEVEKADNGETAEENTKRKRRIRFYEKLGCCKMGFCLDLFTVVYVPYILPCKQKEFNDKEVIENILKMYYEVIGYKKFWKNCKLLGE